MLENIGKKINLISFIFALIIPPSFFAYSFFKNGENPAIFLFLKYGSLVAAAAIIFFFIYKIWHEKKPKEANTVLFFINFSYVLLILDATGGVASPFFFVFIVLIISGFFLSLYYGIAAVGVSILYIFFDLLYHGKLPTLEDADLIRTFGPIILGIAPAYFLGEIYRENIKEKKDMKGLVEKLSTDKNQEEAIFSSIADGVYAVDTERNLVLFNPVAEEMTGWTEKTALGIKCWTVMKLKNEQDLSVCEKDCPMLQVWNTGENIVRDDLCFINKSKKNIQTSGAYSPIKDLNGKTTGGICVFRDVTKQKELERQRNEFVSTASHELRTPITTLEGYISLASDEKVSKVDEKAKGYLDKAHTAVVNMSNLVKNLLSVTKIDEGKLDAYVEKFVVNDLIQKTVEELQPLAKNKGITLEFKKSGGSEKGKKSFAPQIKVEADVSMIKEVLTNLIENGIKFTVRGGVTVSIKTDKDFAIVSVNDTGMGIPKDGQKHLFEKFYRVDNTATREVGGTGLGLYITRSIVENFGGKIWVESQEKKGSTFTFTVPRTLD